MLGLPARIHACLFDLHGVLTQTAYVLPPAPRGRGGASRRRSSIADTRDVRAGRFGVVVGADRVGRSEQPRVHGADVVVRDLADPLEER